MRADVVGQTLRPAGRRRRAAAARRDADRRAGAVRRHRLRCPIHDRETRSSSYVRAHLADELELDPARVEEGTRFKEDLEADSLDLYSLVQELEDTYGVRMSDEEAARIKTVGQAVDFVLANVATREPRP